MRVIYFGVFTDRSKFSSSNTAVPESIEMSENSEIFENPTGESFEITTTHWLNERPIGDGEGPVLMKCFLSIKV